MRSKYDPCVAFPCCGCQLGKCQSRRDCEAIVLALINEVLALVRTSGATEEESLAALRAAEAIVPILELESAKRKTIRT